MNVRKYEAIHARANACVYKFILAQMIVSIYHVSSNWVKYFPNTTSVSLLIEEERLIVEDPGAQLCQ